jgi:hypothetical protein
MSSLNERCGTICVVPPLKAQSPVGSAAMIFAFHATFGFLKPP